MYEKEFELQLLARLRDPSDEIAERELRRLRPELERARASVEQTIVMAPDLGTVQDVRIRPGEFLEAGDHLLSLAPVDPEYTAIAFLSGHALPQLEVGMPVRLKISGYPYAYLSTAIESVGKQVIGPGEARRYVGAEVADAVELGGSVVVVRCRLDQDRFTAGSEEYRLHDGMRAEAEVELRRERLLVRLIPGLKALGRDHG
jgi:multidrug resistance efflux pump